MNNPFRQRILPFLIGIYTFISFNCQEQYFRAVYQQKDKERMKRTLDGRELKVAGNKVQGVGSICARPHVRAKKMDAWKKASPLAGYLQWREMQLFMNEQMKSVLMDIATVSILPASNKSQLQKLKCPNTIQAYADNDVCHDADVKFFLDGTHRVHPSSLYNTKSPGQPDGEANWHTPPERAS